MKKRIVLSLALLSLACVTLFAETGEMKRIQLEMRAANIQLILGANDTKYYKCTIVDERIAPVWWIEVAHHIRGPKDYTVKLHPAFDSVNGIWLDTLSIFDKRIEWLSAEDLTGQQVMVFWEDTIPAKLGK